MMTGVVSLLSGRKVVTLGGKLGVLGYNYILSFPKVDEGLTGRFDHDYRGVEIVFYYVRIFSLTSELRRGRK